MKGVDGVICKSRSITDVIVAVLWFGRGRSAGREVD